MILAYKLVWKTEFIKSLLSSLPDHIIDIYNNRRLTSEREWRREETDWERGELFKFPYNSVGEKVEIKGEVLLKQTRCHQGECVNQDLRKIPKNIFGTFFISNNFFMEINLHNNIYIQQYL